MRTFKKYCEKRDLQEALDPNTIQGLPPASMFGGWKPKPSEDNQKFKDGKSDLTLNQSNDPNPPKEGDMGVVKYQGRDFVGKILGSSPISSFKSKFEYNPNGRNTGYIFNPEWKKDWPSTSLADQGISFGYDGEQPEWDERLKMWRFVADAD